jgi:uncharacterized membrane protein
MRCGALETRCIAAATDGAPSDAAASKQMDLKMGIEEDAVSTQPVMTEVSKDPLARFAAHTWISDDAQVAAQDAIRNTMKALGGDPVVKALHGDWLHEPLHAALTDVPVGAWTATVACDAVASLTGSGYLDKAADASAIVGLVGAVGSAVTGLNDWSGIEKPAVRRIGAVHALLNVAATGLFVASIVMRGRRHRSQGRALSTLGYLLVTVSAHLGGNLVYEHGVGVGEQ